MNGKSEKLGMSFSTARARLERDILFDLAMRAGHKCHRCGGEMTRESFSVEHIVPWMQTDDPKKMFFDLDNIAFSHAHCNHKEMVERRRVYADAGERSRAAQRRAWDRLPDKVAQRRARYEKYGY